MKTILSAIFLLGIVAISKAIPTRQRLCTDDNIKNLAACGCFVQSTLPGTPKASLEVCNNLFGEDLSFLKPHCRDFVAGDPVDPVKVDQVTGAVEMVKKECTAQLLPAMAATRVDDNQMEHISERWVPLLIGVALLLYAPAAH